MTYSSLRSQASAAMAALRQQVADGTAPPTAALAEINFQQFEDLERANAPLEERVQAIRQVLCAANGMDLPIDYRGQITAERIA